MTQHIVKSFDHDLGQIETVLLEMAGLVEAQIADAVNALLTRDPELGLKVKSNDKLIDRLERQVEELAVGVLARRQPMAQDLRSIVAVLKVSGNLERIGDYAKNIAKRTQVIAQSGLVGSSSGTIKRLAATVQEIIHAVLDAYMARDLDAAADLRQRDEEVDLMHNTLFRELLTYMMEDARNITPCMHLLFVAKNLERMGDHATSICEQIFYIVTGDLPDEKRPKNDQTSYISVDPERGRGSKGQDT